MNTLALLFPDVMLIVFGWVLAARLGWSAGFWTELEKLVYFVLFPALLFRTTLRTDLGGAGTADAIWVALITIAVGIALGYLARPLLKPDRRRFASAVQCAFRFNSFLLLALSQRIGGELALATAAIVIGVTVPLLNVAAVWPLARSMGGGFLRELVRNPLILATAGGLACNLAGVSLAEPIDATLARLGSASIALGLLALGAGLRSQAAAEATGSLGQTLRLVAWVTAVKFLAMPATALLVGMAMGLSGAPLQVVVMYASMPAASSAYILASRMGGDGPFVARVLTISMATALVALPFWLSLTL